MDQEDFSRAYALVYSPNPWIEVADAVLLAASRAFPRAVKNLKRRSGTAAGYLAQMTYLQLFQHTLLKTSIRWEQEQEQELSTDKRVYQADQKVMLARFLKHLTFSTVFRRDCFPLAVAVGCWLYDYGPHQACDIADLPNDEPGYSRRSIFKRNVRDALDKRFTHVLMGAEASHFATQEPSDAQRMFISEALTAFTPWGTRHIRRNPNGPLFERLDNLSTADWRRKHALLCTACAGFARLAAEWRELSRRPVNLSPEAKLRIPVFRPNVPPAPQGSWHLDAPPLSDEEYRERLQRVREILRRYWDLL